MANPLLTVADYYALTDDQNLADMIRWDYQEHTRFLAVIRDGGRMSEGRTDIRDVAIHDALRAYHRTTKTPADVTNLGTALDAARALPLPGPSAWASSCAGWSDHIKIQHALKSYMVAWIALETELAFAPGLTYSLMVGVAIWQQFESSKEFMNNIDKPAVLKGLLKTMSYALWATLAKIAFGSALFFFGLAVYITDMVTLIAAHLITSPGGGLMYPWIYRMGHRLATGAATNWDSTHVRMYARKLLSPNHIDPTWIVNKINKVVQSQIIDNPSGLTISESGKGHLLEFCRSVRTDIAYFNRDQTNTALNRMFTDNCTFSNVAFQQDTLTYYQTATIPWDKTDTDPYWTLARILIAGTVTAYATFRATKYYHEAKTREDKRYWFHLRGPVNKAAYIILALAALQTAYDFSSHSDSPEAQKFAHDTDLHFVEFSVKQITGLHSFGHFASLFVPLMYERAPALFTALLYKLLVPVFMREDTWMPL